jgi:hypothetical protein
MVPTLSLFHHPAARAAPAPMTFAQRNNIWPIANGPWSSAAATSGRVDLFAVELKKTADRACRDNQSAEMYHPVTGEIHGGIQEGRTGRKGAGMKAFVAARLGGSGEPSADALAKLFPRRGRQRGRQSMAIMRTKHLQLDCVCAHGAAGFCGTRLDTDGLTFHPAIPQGMSPVAVHGCPIARPNWNSTSPARGRRSGRSRSTAKKHAPSQRPPRARDRDGGCNQLTPVHDSFHENSEL